MKKIVGIIIGLVVIIAIVVGVLYSKGNLGNTPSVQPEDTVFTQYYEDYLSQISQNNDANIYNNLLEDKLRKAYTIEQISQMNDYLRSLGEVKKNDKNNIKVEPIKEGNKTIYVISSVIDYSPRPHLVKIELVRKGNDYKIRNFSFTNEF